MIYNLREEISYCATHAGLIFLDVGRDRYFRLPRRLESAFLAAVGGKSVSAQQISTLKGFDLFTDAKLAEGARPIVPSAGRSAVESSVEAGALDAKAALEVFLTVTRTHAMLKTCSLNRVLKSIDALRKRHLPASAHHADPVNTQQRAMVTSATYRQARRFVPIQPVCLLDSLSLTRFLTRRGIYATIVFGVTAAPFSAHCWVQTGRTVLNDTVGHSSEFTQIRVV